MPVERSHQAAVRIWLVRANDADPAPLSDDEWARASRLRQPAARQTWIAVRSMLRRVLAEQLTCAPEAIRFAADERGKPGISAPENPQDVRFSVSHSGDAGLIAVAHGREIGVDLEAMRPGVDVPALARRVFVVEEAKMLEQLTGDVQWRVFYRYWVRKEAAVKATGHGLWKAGSPFCVVPDYVPRLGVTLADTIAPEGYAAAVAVCGSEQPVVISYER